MIAFSGCGTEVFEGCVGTSGKYTQRNSAGNVVKDANGNPVETLKPADPQCSASPEPSSSPSPGQPAADGTLVYVDADSKDVRKL